MNDKICYAKPYTFNGEERLARYHLTAEGQRCRTDDTEKLSEFKGLIKDSGHEVGKEVYTIKYDEGLEGSYTLGWVVVFDVDRLFEEVFNERESILPEAESEKQSGDFMLKFLRRLDEKGIAYNEGFINMD